MVYNMISPFTIVPVKIILYLLGANVGNICCRHSFKLFNRCNSYEIVSSWQYYTLLDKFVFRKFPIICQYNLQKEIY